MHCEVLHRTVTSLSQLPAARSNPAMDMRTNHRAAYQASPQLGFLLDELRAVGRTTYADLAASLNRQGLRPSQGRWKPQALYNLMRRHRRAHPAAALHVGAMLYARRAEEARRVIRRLRRRGLNTHAMIAGALNARGLTTPRLGRPWTARSISRVLSAAPRRKTIKRTIH
jgi:hypothetical protein